MAAPRDPQSTGPWVHSTSDLALARLGPLGVLIHGGPGLFFLPPSLNDLDRGHSLGLAGFHWLGFGCSGVPKPQDGGIRRDKFTLSREGQTDTGGGCVCVSEVCVRGLLNPNCYSR